MYTLPPTSSHRAARPVPTKYTQWAIATAIGVVCIARPLHVFAQTANTDPPTEDASVTSSDTAVRSAVSRDEMHQITAAAHADAEAQPPTQYEDSEGHRTQPAPKETQGRKPPLARATAALSNALNPEISLILDLAASYFNQTDTAPGISHARYPRMMAFPEMGAHDPSRNGFTFQELELGFKASVDPYFVFKAYLSVDEDGLDLEEVFVNTTSLPGRLQLRVGKFLEQFGRINGRHPHVWSFVDTPLIIGRFLGQEGLGGLGVEISWLAPTPWYLEIIASGIHADHARSFRGPHNNVHSMRDFVYTGRIKNFFAFGPSWSLTWGISGAWGSNDGPVIFDGDGERMVSPAGHALTQIYGTDLYLRYRPVNSTSYRAFTLQLELMHRRRKVRSHMHHDTGLYAQTLWRISRRWETGLRYDWVSGAPGDDLDPQWTRPRQRVSLQATLYPSHFSRIRVQGNYDAPQWMAQPIWGAMLSLEFVVGAHGAHPF